MGHSKPFHRIHRAHEPGPNSGYSNGAYIVDRDYAANAEHYVRAFTLIQKDLQDIFEYVEPADECRPAYSYRMHALLMRTCIEVEANFNAILKENTFTFPARSVNMNDYRKVDVSHHLSSFEVSLPIWNPAPLKVKPFGPWLPVRGTTQFAPLPWYQAYNASKHNRQDEFRKANLEALVTAVAGLLVLITAQFRSEDFSAGDSSLSWGGNDDFHELEAATGSLFRIKYPDDWTNAELYDFDWSVLKTQSNRFEKFDYDVIP